ncbi:MAG: TonB-dependent receptor [Chrysiogenetes bacterium]|nr:TonB-dependent receptor [Chrysiogenetes bacterium]
MALAVLALALPSRAFAQESPARAQQTEELPEIVVEGERIAEPKADPIASATVIEREEIESEPVGAGELLNRDEGVRVRELGGLGSFSTISIRGSTSDQVRVMLDGVPLERASNGGVDLSIIPTENLDRIEIYRGVAPLSAGGSAIGGVVSLTSIVPEKDALSLLAGGGSFGWRQGALHATHAKKDSPYAALLSLSYEGAENDFSFRNPAGTPTVTSDDFDDERRNADFNRGDALVRVIRKLPRGGSLSLTEVFGAREQGVNIQLSATPQSATRLFEARSLTSLALDLPGLTDYSSLEAHAFFTFSRLDIDDPLGELLGGLDTKDDDYVAGANVLFGHYIFDPLKAEAFAEFRHERFSPKDEALLVNFPSSSRNQLTLAGGLEYEALTEELLLVAQVRYEHASDDLNGSNAGTPTTGGSSHNEVTARGGVRWEPRQWLLLSTNLSRAVRLPNFSELFGNTGFVRGNPDLRPETSINFDAGAALEWKDLPLARKAGVGVRYFRSNVDDLITFRLNGAGVLLVCQAGINQCALTGAENQGVELAAKWELPRFLAWEGNFTWTRARQKPSDNFELPFVPQWQAYTRLRLEDSFAGKASSAGLWLDFEYVGANFLGPANLSEAPERRIFGAGAFVRFFNDELQLTLSAKNITNEKSLINFSNQPLPGLTLLGQIRWRAI